MKSMTSGRSLFALKLADDISLSVRGLVASQVTLLSMTPDLVQCLLIAGVLGKSTIQSSSLFDNLPSLYTINQL